MGRTYPRRAALVLLSSLFGLLRSGNGHQWLSETADDGDVLITALVVAGLAGCPVFPADNYWNTPITGLPVHPSSAAWIQSMPDVDLHPDFGGSEYGIPITTTRHTPRTRVRFDYAQESDRVRYPLRSSTRIEGGSDRHTVVVDVRRCRLYETWNTRRTPGGWRAGSGAVWNLRSNALRPAGWTSADAAGLPILPGLLRWSEVRAGHVDHAIRFTAPTTAPRYLWPARHQAGSDPSSPPMGARFRLAAGFDMSGYSPRTRTVLTAMKTYGLVLADNGSPWYFQGERSTKWPARLLDELKTVPSSAFEAVDTSSWKVSADSAATRAMTSA